MRSILQDKEEKVCFLCAMLNRDSRPKNWLEEHHVFFGQALRKLSEKHGLKVYLCVDHHRGSENGVHYSIKNNRLVQAYAQRSFEETHSREEFMNLFGRNYITEENEGKPAEVAGFKWLGE